MQLALYMGFNDVRPFIVLPVRNVRFMFVPECAVCCVETVGNSEGFSSLW